MDPQTSFRLPLLLRQSMKRASLSPKIVERLNRTIAFKEINETDQSFRDTRTIQELSPRICMRLNPGYRQEYSMARSEMKNRFRDHSKGRNHAVDKFFHKKKDEMVTYTENFFKNKILHGKR
ncbi:unnamed protein product [Blepharisma stoltei]|uniref:Uncharacterized protein n=1 Tax=Blepharisma stoltei TaxID=1481888 RepID=A0AAU9J2U7_9CILI|nr:unnamed protein product [Blepharisma stoltei]